MDSIDISSGREAMLQDAIVLDSLPPELLEIIRSSESRKFLDALATASLIPGLTVKIFVCFEIIFADTCARWISNPQYERNAVLAAFARILRFAPHLSVYLEKYLRQPAPPPPTNTQRRQFISIQYL